MADLDFIRDSQGNDLRRPNYFRGPRKLSNMNEHDVPQSPGAYILLC